MIFHLFWLCIIVYCLFFFFLITGIMRNSQKTSHKVRTNLPRVSLIIAVKNEQENIASCLQSIKNQDYPQELLEIIVVDDNSQDHTAEIAAAAFKGVQVVKNAGTDWKSSKKQALNAGILHASGPIIALTDADCRPSPSWIKTLVHFYDDHTDLVAGFSPQHAKAGSWWNGFLATDSLAAALVSAASIGWSHGITCTGRNLSYTKKAFLSARGFADLPDSVSGDDDFILQTIGKKGTQNIRYVYSERGQVAALGPENFKAFIKQKQRHISSGKYFTTWQKIGFGLYHLINIILWSGIIAALVTSQHYLLMIVGLKFILDYAALLFFSSRLERDLPIHHFMYWQLLFPIYNVLAAPVAFLSKIEWK
jgi:glycosyltransferase involved in cell wall biosynthesis